MITKQKDDITILYHESMKHDVVNSCFSHVRSHFTIPNSVTSITLTPTPFNNNNLSGYHLINGKLHNFYTLHNGSIHLDLVMSDGFKEDYEKKLGRKFRELVDELDSIGGKFFPETIL